MKDIDGDHLDEAASANVIMVSCGAVNTLALTDWGDVYVSGDNSYGQHASEEVKIQAPTLNTVNI
jgi:alpha-tubulin suppressor-like RCC1 family protein